MIIEMTLSSAAWALVGGLIIGLSAALLLLFNGRIAGISGITSRLLPFKRGHTLWRAAFVAGLVSGGFVLSCLMPDPFTTNPSTSLWRLAAAGLLVGFGSSLGGGCTSGHGVCGISRLSKRSITATLTFMATGFITVFLMRHWGVWP